MLKTNWVFIFSRVRVCFSYYLDSTYPGWQKMRIILFLIMKKMLIILFHRPKKKHYEKNMISIFFIYEIMIYIFS